MCTRQFSWPWSNCLRKVARLSSVRKSSVNCIQFRLGKCHKLLALNISPVWRLYVRDNGPNLRMAFYRKFNITHWALVMGLLPFTLVNRLCVNCAAENCLRLSLLEKVTPYPPSISQISLQINSRMFWDASYESVYSVKPFSA